MNNEGRSRSPQSEALHFIVKHYGENECCSVCHEKLPIDELWYMEENLYCGVCLHMVEED